jgi:cell division protease FtsH
VALFNLVQQSDVTSVRYVPAPQGRAQIIQTLLPFVLLYIWYRVMKSLVQRDEKYTQPRRDTRKVGTEICFADVITKSKVELVEIVEYLNRPEKFRRAGARLPRGALLVGPSGTGKTLLARAVAGEAKCRFISAAASEFVEVYVGRGAARVRDLFEQARNSGRCVLFFDELDALGSRSGGSSGSNQEYVQTLNQLLTELDGFHGQGDGLVVIGASNRREAIDAALLRPGRFDRHIFMELPDSDERLQILQVHVRKVPSLAGVPDGTLMRVVEKTPGFSGAELANIINEAVFLALRAGRSCASMHDLLDAVERANVVRQGVTAQTNGDVTAGFARAFFRGAIPPVAMAQ